ncbi:TPA: hypothetical protein GX533_01495 [Candidatus Dojkabacteria bacterium]|jgi:hypothetical protein|uniref:Uncharacterized protein n=1 Tax=Candidatus Dojkabacteria bacterium TaxID=2099670 RepID=A0A832QH75_9BACT|nr:hypothetical protein [Candidatus Dojkabacteria bacterium]
MTLTEASFWTRRLGVIAIIAILIVGITLSIIFWPKKIKPPEEYLIPNYACTDTKEEFLEKALLDIPSLEIDPASEALFSVNTDTGKVNTLPSIINVYKYDLKTQSSQALFEAENIAARLGFDKEKMTGDDQDVYVWRDPVNKRRLTVYKRNMNFRLETDVQQMRMVSDHYGGTLPDEATAKTRARSILSSLGKLDDTMQNTSEDSIGITYIRINSDGTYRKAASLSQADLIRVNFRREKSMITISSNLVGAEEMVKEMIKAVGKEPTKVATTINDKKVDIYTFDALVTLPRIQDTNISVYIGPENKESKLQSNLRSLYQIDFTYWPVFPDSCGTYPLITTQAALDKVMAGEGKIVYLYEKDGDFVSEYMQKNVKRFTITENVRIVYYETPEEQEFLVPVYLFSGEAEFADGMKGDFDIYYPAIDYDNIQNKRVSTPPPEEEVEKKDTFF